MWGVAHGTVLSARTRALSSSCSSSQWSCAHWAPARESRARITPDTSPGPSRTVTVSRACKCRGRPPHGRVGLLVRGDSCGPQCQWRLRHRRGAGCLQGTEFTDYVVDPQSATPRDGSLGGRPDVPRWRRARRSPASTLTLADCGHVTADGDRRRGGRPVDGVSVTPYLGRVPGRDWPTAQQPVATDETAGTTWTAPTRQRTGSSSRLPRAAPWAQGRGTTPTRSRPAQRHGESRLRPPPLSTWMPCWTRSASVSGLATSPDGAPLRGVSR